MPVRLAIHVGPHKTGSTSVQQALAAARDALVERGVLYPRSVPGAAWPTQHADIWLLLRNGEEQAAWEWLSTCRGDAERRGCDTLLLSSENFHARRVRPALARLMSRWRRDTRGDVRPLYVRRDLVDLACSRAVSHVLGETGFYYHQRYDLRDWARRFAVEQVRHERWFARHRARFVPLLDGPRTSLAARILEAATDRPFPEIVTGDHRITDRGLENTGAILSYGLRVMHGYVTGDGANRPAAFAATLPMLPAAGLDEKAFASLAEAFRDAVTRDVREGIEDFRRLSPLARQWRLWFEKTRVNGGPPG